MNHFDRFLSTNTVYVGWLRACTLIKTTKQEERNDLLTLVYVKPTRWSFYWTSMNDEIPNFRGVAYTLRTELRNLPKTIWTNDFNIYQRDAISLILTVQSEIKNVMCSNYQC